MYSPIKATPAAPANPVDGSRMQVAPFETLSPEKQRELRDAADKKHQTIRAPRRAAREST
jgi:hypothetical protein